MRLIPYRDSSDGLSVPLDAFVHYPTRSEAKALYNGALPQWDTEITLVCEATVTGRVRDCAATDPDNPLATATETPVRAVCHCEVAATTLATEQAAYGL